ncbi:hypothetical protein Pcinc_042447 [Petrolisthes cinctipes]|uniref:Uncharacterized protein n=1 Tax=Petrolisthes cinctipes TaxID=88211 RepID=A0AAE1EG04_PETCI|nr:hypothetical protein Pcinc_042447 [Petrolisthes cinctipes]
MGGGEMSDVEMGGGGGNVMLYVQVVLVPDEYVAATGQEVVYRAEASGTQLRYDWLLPGNLLLIDQELRLYVKRFARSRTIPPCTLKH